MDLGTPFHTPITALFAGVVRFAGRTLWNSQGGSSGGEVTIVCSIPGLGVFTSYYLHVDTVAVKVGDKVNAGQVIALSGGQLSGGQWPVVNRGGYFSNGPHTEFGFNAPWVSGPGHQIDPTWAIMAARAGKLPNTNPNNAPAPPSSGNDTSGATAPAPAQQVTWVPTLTESLLINAAALQATTHKVVTQPTGWDGICQDIDYQEKFPPFQWMNPLGSVWADLPPLGIRGLVVVIGLAIILYTVKDWLTSGLSAANNATGLVERAGLFGGTPAGAGGPGGAAGGGAEAGGALAEAPLVAAV